MPVMAGIVNVPLYTVFERVASAQEIQIQFLC